MGYLSQVHTGKRQQPPRLLVYGTEGIGKSTLASQAPNPIFVQTEDGLDQIDCASFPLAKTFEEVKSTLHALLTENHDFQTVVIDSVDWLERLVWEDLRQRYGVSSIDKVDGDYGRGYMHSLVEFRGVLDLLGDLRTKRGMCVILLAHAKVEKFEDPEHAAYDRYSPRLHKHVSALLTEWSDAVLFATRKIMTKTQESGFGKGRTIASGIGKGGGERVLRTVGSPSCVAKNRYQMPAEMPLSWQKVLDAISGSNDQPISSGYSNNHNK
ncbi:MAG: ATP-binding protein [Pseudomonadales bacterium]|nr:ATP-binding protein [Pseudomonadales bacterium]